MSEDPTNPSYYKDRSIETIDYIDALEDLPYHYEVGCIIKYLARFPYKNGSEDLEKAKWYLDRLIERWKE